MTVNDGTKDQVEAPQVGEQEARKVLHLLRGEKLDASAGSSGWKPIASPRSGTKILDLLTEAGDTGEHGLVVPHDLGRLGNVTEQLPAEPLHDVSADAGDVRFGNPCRAGHFALLVSMFLEHEDTARPRHVTGRTDWRRCAGWRRVLSGSLAPLGTGPFCAISRDAPTTGGCAQSAWGAGACARPISPAHPRAVAARARTWREMSTACAERSSILV